MASYKQAQPPKIESLQTTTIQSKQTKRREKAMAFSWNKEKISRKPAARNLALTALLSGAVLAGIVGVGGATGAGAASNNNGDLDPTFGDGGGIAFNFGGTDDIAYGMALQSGGKIVVAGEARPDTQSLTDFALTRLLPNG